MRLGVDLRVLPADGTAGSGIPQATRELWRALVPLALAYEIELIGAILPGADAPLIERCISVTASGKSLRAMQRAHRLEGWIVPSGAVSPWVFGKLYPWVHDIAIFAHPEWFPQSWWTRWRTTRLFTRGLQRAQHVFAVSQTTKDDLVERWPQLMDGVTVTSEGGELPPKNLPWPSRVPAGATYLLALGTVEPRKNILFLCEVWKALHATRHANQYLVIAGKDGWGAKLTQHDPSILRVSDLANAERDGLFAHAAAVCVPSLYEGFGRTALTALAHGRPTFVSDRGALPEIVGPVGRVLPLEGSAWKEALGAVLEVGTKASSLDVQAQNSARTAWASQFTWEHVARTLLARIQADC